MKKFQVHIIQDSKLQVTENPDQTALSRRKLLLFMLQA